MPRPIGQRIRQACEMVEMYGPCGYSVISSETGIPRANASKYCIRAVALGLMTVQKPGKRGQKHNFAIYSVVPGWREKLGVERPIQRRTVQQKVSHIVSFVFNLGEK